MINLQFRPQKTQFFQIQRYSPQETAYWYTLSTPGGDAGDDGDFKANTPHESNDALREHSATELYDKPLSEHDLKLFALNSKDLKKGWTLIVLSPEGAARGEAARGEASRQVCSTCQAATQNH